MCQCSIDSPQRASKNIVLHLQSAIALSNLFETNLPPHPPRPRKFATCCTKIHETPLIKNMHESFSPTTRKRTPMHFRRKKNFIIVTHSSIQVEAFLIIVSILLNLYSTYLICFVELLYWILSWGLSLISSRTNVRTSYASWEFFLGGAHIGIMVKIRWMQKIKIVGPK